MEDHVSFDFPFRVTHSRRKTAAIHVSKMGVEVRLPFGVSQQFAHEFVHSKLSWVQQKWQQQQAKANQLPKLAFGETLLWLGEPHTLVFQRSARRKQVFIQANCLVLESPTQPSPSEMAAMLESFFKVHAKRRLPQQTVEKAKSLGLVERLTDVRFRRTKTKWGHCTSKGVIQYNWMILGAPEAVIDYLVCHEVCHLKHPHHGPAFWAEVKRACPDYQLHERWLNQQSHRLDWIASIPS